MEAIFVGISTNNRTGSSLCFQALLLLIVLLAAWLLEAALRKLNPNENFALYYMYNVCTHPYYTKIKSKRKFKIWNIKLSKTSLSTVYYFCNC